MHPHSASFEVGPSDAPFEVVIVHGYTGSPDEFREIADLLVGRLNAHVTVPLLPGHGTSEEDLVKYSMDDLLNAAEKVIEVVARKGKPFALVGHSFGGHLVSLVARKYPPKAAVLTVMPYDLRPPFSIPGMDLYARTKKFWDKPLPKKELEDRKKFFFYKRMPGIGLSMLKVAIKRVQEIAPKLSFPILTINNREDPMCYPEGGEKLLKESGGNPHNKSIVLEKKEHGLFYGDGKDEVLTHIVDFIEKNIRA